MTQTLQRLGSAAWRVGSLPATLLHELTHFVLGLPWADESAIVADGDGVVHGINWEPDTPQWAIVMCSLGPTILGSLVGAVGLWRLVVAPPGTTRTWLLAGALAAYWVIYVTPSGDDLDIHDNTEQ